MNLNYLHIISIFTLFVSVALFHKCYKSNLIKCLFFASFMLSMVMNLTYYICNYFTGEGINQACTFYLRYGLTGAGFSEYIHLIIFSILLIIISCLVFVKLCFYKKNVDYLKINLRPAGFFVCVSLLSNPIFPDIYHLYRSYRVDINNTESFHRLYKEPHIELDDTESKNFIFIFAESLERTYFDTNVFKELVPNLTVLRDECIDFSNIAQVPGTEWTIGGIFAAYSGMPLFSPSHGNSMSGMDLFMPKAVSLTDLLVKDGYYLSFISGADLVFGGKGKYFRTHGFNEVLGKEELLGRSDKFKQLSGWGIYDEDLLDFTYERFIELSESNRKFGITILTLDTHHPYGHVSISSVSYKDGKNPILNAVASADIFLSNFIKRILKSQYSNNTVIVLASDHLAMRNTAYKKLISIPRKNLFMLFNPDNRKGETVSTKGSFLDISATLLPFLGYSGEIGLGRDLMLNNDSIIAEREVIRRNILPWRKNIMKFWDFPKIKNTLRINVEKRIVQIDDRSFQYPLLIEVDKNLETVIRFFFHASISHKTLIEHAAAVDVRNSYFLIERYSMLKNVLSYFKYIPEEGLSEEQFFLLVGAHKKIIEIIKLENDIVYNTQDLMALVR